VWNPNFHFRRLRRFKNFNSRGFEKRRISNFNKDIENVVMIEIV
jgi:hypothetical protein